MNLENLRVIYTQEKDRYLLVPDFDVSNEHSRQARILDMSSKTLYPPSYRPTVLAQGYWDEGTMEKEATIAMLKQVRVL